MTSAASLAPTADLASFRARFPALERVVYLDTASAAPGAAPVVEALHRAEREWQSGVFSWRAWESEAHATRALFARLVGGDERDVALRPTLSDAVATVARSLPPGKVVVGEREFRSNLFPWLQLRERGREVVVVPAADGVVRGEALARAVDEGTALVAVTEVQSSNGFRVRLADLTARCRAVGARLFVNLTQSLGALRFDGAAVRPDFAAATSYKWLIGVRGAAWLYVRPDRLAEVEPLAPNWKSTSEPYADYYGVAAAPTENDPGLDLAPDARRLDTSLGWFPWIGSRAGLELLSTLDAAAVEERCLALARAFRADAARAGCELVPEEVPSHIVGVRLPDPDGVKARLAQRRVIAAVRGGTLRIGFHAFNDDGDAEAALAALRRAGP
jgi:selenocysteine lyase/cysteine desulfurase